MTLLPILWEEPEEIDVTSYCIEHLVNGETLDTTEVYYNTTYYTAAVEMGDSSNCFIITAHTQNDTEHVVGKGCTNTSE